MNYRELCKRLKRLGFFFLREGSCHEIWGKGTVTLAVPRKKIVNIFTAKRIIKDAEQVRA